MGPTLLLGTDPTQGTQELVHPHIKFEHVAEPAAYDEVESEPSMVGVGLTRCSKS